MADVAVKFLVENLMQLLIDNADLILSIKGEVEDLLRDLKDFNAFLKQAAKSRKENEVLKEMVKKIRKVVNDAEDSIDKFVIEAKRHDDKNKFLQWFHLTHVARAKGVADEIKSIRERVKEIRENDSYGLQAIALDDNPNRGDEERKVILSYFFQVYNTISKELRYHEELIFKILNFEMSAFSETTSL